MKSHKALAPIAYFAFNRPDHTLQSLTAIMNSSLAEESVLFIFCDGPRKFESENSLNCIKEVRDVVRSCKWCKNVIITEAETNIGLMRSISIGISRVLENHDRIIVVEDDVLVSKGFLQFMNEALDMYEGDEEVMHISGYSPLHRIGVSLNESTFFYNHTTCWGWATWKRAWNKFSLDAMNLRKAMRGSGRMAYINLDNTFEAYWGIKHIMDGRFQSWNYFWHTCVNLARGLCLHPSISMVTNIGFDGSGTNCTVDGRQENLVAESLEFRRIPLKEDLEIRSHLHKTSFFTKVKFLARHYLKYIFK